MLAAGWLRTGRRWLLSCLVATLLLTVAAVLLERFVQTDRERINATLHQIASLVERNRIDEALQYAFSGTPQVRRQAAAELPLYDFQMVDIKRNLEVELIPNSVPPRAEARFNVVVTLTVRNQGLNNLRVPRYCEVTFIKELDGVWRVAAYSHHDPRRGWITEEAQSPDWQ